MARRGENIYLRKDGRWEGRYIKGRKENGKAVFGYLYGRRYRDVKRLVAAARSRLCAEEQPILTYRRGTLSDWLCYWLEEEVRPTVKATTYDSYACKINKHIQPYLGELPIRGLTREQAAGYVRMLLRRVAPGTAQGVLRVLRAALRSACKKKLIGYSPLEGMKMPRVQQKKPRVLRTEEQRKLEGASVDAGRVEYVLALYTGLRLGELCALRWEDVDFEGNTLHVRHTLSRVKLLGGKTTMALTTPKSESSVREVPVPASVMALVRALRHTGQGEGFVFGRGEKPADPRTMQTRLKKLTEKLGIGGAHMHTLRHTYATRCLERQIGHEVLCELLGHSSPEVTYRYYAHCTLEHKKECVGRLERACV